MTRREFKQGGRHDVLDGYVLRLEAVAANKKLTRLHGRAVTYNSFTPRGWYQLQVGPGSLDKSIAEAGGRLPLLLFHNWESFPIGTAVDWDSTRKALDGEWEVADTEEAQRAAQAAKDGHLTGLSIGFAPILSEWEFNEDAASSWPVTDVRDLDKMTLVEGRLLETSLTPTPAIATAKVGTVLARPRHASGTPRLDGWIKYRDSLHTTGR